MVDPMSLEQRQAWMQERQQALNNSEGPHLSTPDFAQRHYHVAEIAKMWGLSVDFVRDLFINEPGVVVFGDEPKPGTRRYRTLLIPESVVVRVYRRSINPERTKC